MTVHLQTTGGGVWFAPGRANLMGEHTDYNEGLVLPFALAQGVTASVTRRDDGLLVMRSRQIDDVVTVPVSDLSPVSVRGWAAYPAGVAWALRSADVPVPGATIEIASNLPVGAGVSSSAALECSVALGLCEISGVAMSRRALAAVARQAENEFVGAPTGIIDQHVSLLSEAGHAMLLDCATRSITQVPFCPSSAGVATLIIDTRVAHALVSGEYGRRRAQCEEAARQLGVPFLGQVTSVADASRLDDPMLRRRARHVISDTARARAIASALADGIPSGTDCAPAPADETSAPADGSPTPADGTPALADGTPARMRPAGDVGGPSAGRSGPGTGSPGTGGPGTGGPGTGGDMQDLYRYIGGLLSEAHISLRDDFEISWPEADITVETAIGAGAYGARMIGGGFGGSVLALVPGPRLAAVRSALIEAFAARSWTAPQFMDAVPSAAARRLA